jgi:hypothetical protein
MKWFLEFSQLFGLAMLLGLAALLVCVVVASFKKLPAAVRRKVAESDRRRHPMPCFYCHEVTVVDEIGRCKPCGWVNDNIADLKRELRTELMTVTVLRATGYLWKLP